MPKKREGRTRDCEHLTVRPSRFHYGRDGYRAPCGMNCGKALAGVENALANVANALVRVANAQTSVANA